MVVEKGATTGGKPLGGKCQKVPQDIKGRKKVAPREPKCAGKPPSKERERNRRKKKPLGKPVGKTGEILAVVNPKACVETRT